MKMVSEKSSFFTSSMDCRRICTAEFIVHILLTFAAVVKIPVLLLMQFFYEDGLRKFYILYFGVFVASVSCSQEIYKLI